MEKITLDVDVECQHNVVLMGSKNNAILPQFTVFDQLVVEQFEWEAIAVRAQHTFQPETQYFSGRFLRCGSLASQKNAGPQRNYENLYVAHATFPELRCAIPHRLGMSAKTQYLVILALHTSLWPTPR